MLNNSYFPQNPQQNIISGQILQANSVESVSAIKMMPNSSCLVAHSTLPIIFRCVSDSLGNVSTRMYDISPHKSEEEVKAETMENRLSTLEQHLLEIEQMLRPSPVPSA